MARPRRRSGLLQGVCRMRPKRSPSVVRSPTRRSLCLETSGRLAPVGVIGELCIGGEGVARGYRKRPELTAEKFVPVALPDGRTVRASIARATWLASAATDSSSCSGRRDYQVKVRGYRIELGEIEAVLDELPRA